jgi:hypothetical protein
VYFLTCPFGLSHFGRDAVRLKVCSESARGTGARLLADGDVGTSAELGDFAGMLAIDKWTGNADGRQAAFWRNSREQKYTATFIDQGYCFNAGEWSFPDSPLRGVYARNEVYESVRGWESFEPWLSRVEEMDADTIWGLARAVPPDWYSRRSFELEKLVYTLKGRQKKVRRPIQDLRNSPRHPFPHWLASLEDVA